MGMLGRGLLTAAVVVAADQASKLAVIRYFAGLPADGAVRVTPFLDIVLWSNRGVAFSMFNNGGSANAVVFSVLALAVVAGLVMWLRRTESWQAGLAIGMIIGGALGNMLDRLRLGGVVDFLDFYVGSWHWPAFNVADSAITVGVAILLLDSLLPRAESPK